MDNANQSEPIIDLREAAICGDIDAARQALAAGAPVNGRLEYGKTPVMFAIQNAHLEMLTFLKSKGARLNMLDEDREHPMIYLFTNCQQDHADQTITEDRTMAVLRTLVMLGADKRARGEFGTPAFHYAAGHMAGKHLMEMSELGLEIGGIDPFGASTVLHALAVNKALVPTEATVLISAAIDAGVDIDLLNLEKKTALMVAQERGNDVFSTALREANASEPAVPQSAATSSPRRPGPR